MTGKKTQDLIPLATQARKITFPAHFFSVRSFLSVSAGAAGFDRVQLYFSFFLT